MGKFRCRPLQQARSPSSGGVRRSPGTRFRVAHALGVGRTTLEVFSGTLNFSLEKTVIFLSKLTYLDPQVGKSLVQYGSELRNLYERSA